MFDFIIDLFDVDFFFDFNFGGRPGGRPGRQLPTRAPQVQAAIAAAAVPSPVPTSPAPSPTPVFRTPPIFPGGPAANDPIFRAPKTPIGVAALGRLTGLGGLVISAADILVKVVTAAQIESLGDIIRQQDREIAEINTSAALEKIARERALEVSKKVEALLGAPETFELPQELPEPQTIPSEIPGIFGPASIPTVSPSPTPAPFPGADPATLPDIFPSAPGRTIPAPIPTGVPAPVPLPFPLPFGLPFQIPFSDPSPIGDFGLPEPTPIGTGSQFDVGTVELPFPQPQPQTDPARKCRPRKCDEDGEDRAECFKGLYRESLRSTDFTQWVEVDCVTGREL